MALCAPCTFLQPWGFRIYLVLAFCISFAFPAAAMAACAPAGVGGLGLRLLAGYQAAFGVQIALEAKLFNRERGRAGWLRCTVAAALSYIA